MAERVFRYLGYTSMTLHQKLFKRGLGIAQKVHEFIDKLDRLPLNKKLLSILALSFAAAVGITCLACWLVSLLISK